MWLQHWHGWCHMKLQPSQHKFCVHHTTMHHVTPLSITINEILKRLSSLPILMQESFWWWQCSDRYIMISLFPHLANPPPPLLPVPNKPCGFCDVKHHVYLLAVTDSLSLPLLWNSSWPQYSLGTAPSSTLTSKYQVLFLFSAYDEGLFFFCSFLVSDHPGAVYRHD